jgi:hypothetical protein
MIHTRAFKYVLIACLAILLSSLACSIDFGNDTDDEVSMEQTLVALQLTQTALENQSPEETEEEPVLPTEEPQPEEPEVVPDILYEGISFSFDPSVGSNVNAATIPAQNMGEDYMPGETYPTHYEFTFDTYAVGERFHTPKVIVYPVDDFIAISPYAADEINGLKNALGTHPTGGLHQALPFLPLWNAAQIFNASVEYFDFQNGSGLRYLTMYGQALYPVDNQNLFYTYQGMTYDNQYYISAVMPVIHLGLPDDGYSEIDDWEEFSNNFDSYITETVVWLESQEPNTFSPNLIMLDEMIASFEINP